MNKKFYRVKLWTMRAGFWFYVEASTKDEAIGVAYRKVTEDHNDKPMFVKFLAIEEVKQ